jgi:hypothetical protein
VNVRQYNEVNRAVKCCLFILLLCLPHCFVWHSFYCSVYPIVLSDIHFTALFNPLYCLTFTLLLCLPHCFVWHSFYCSVYPIVLSDIHFSALFIHFIALFFRKMNKQSNKVNVRQYNGVNNVVKWLNRALKWINRATKWMSDNIMG